MHEEFSVTSSTVRSAVLSAVNMEWQSPPVGVFKVNVDATFHRWHNSSVTGTVIRDSSSVIQTSALSRHYNVDFSLLAEFFAILNCLCTTRIQLKSDCLLAITELKKSRDF
ncbi:hypothetical protein PTKIN_Ptkin01aG0129500 [Pterospermum kingtungense]